MPELTKRYIVMPMATEAPFDLKDPDGAFVLKPWKDPAALRALEAYRDNCYPELAQELGDWIRAIKAGSVIRGDVGKRNEPFVKPARPVEAAKPPAKPKAQIKLKKKAAPKAKARTTRARKRH